MILHNSQSPYYRSPRGAVPTDTTVRLALDITDEKLKVESVKLYTWQESLGATYKKMMPSAWDENHYIIDFLASMPTILLRMDMSIWRKILL